MNLQQQMTQQVSTVIAPEPGRKFARAYFLFGGGMVALGIVLSFLPEPFRDELFWYQLPGYGTLPLPFPPLFNIVFPLIYIVPFINISDLLLPTQRKWRTLEKRRQQAVESRLGGRETATFPLSEVHTPLPATITVRVRRNWRATWIRGALYALPTGYILFAFTFNWQIIMHYLAQQGEISGWTLLGGIIYALFYCYCIFLFPVLSAFLLAPRQSLIATQDGLMCYRGLHFAFIPWHEAQLFAVIAQQGETLVGELSSRTSVIRWSSRPAKSYSDMFPPATMGTAPLGLIQAENSIEEYQWQVRQLMAMVAARTGLPLSDLRAQTASKRQQALLQSPKSYRRILEVVRLVVDWLL